MGAIPFVRWKEKKAQAGIVHRVTGAGAKWVQLNQYLTAAAAIATRCETIKNETVPTAKKNLISNPWKLVDYYCSRHITLLIGLLYYISYYVK